MDKKNIKTTQIRLSQELYDYIRAEAKRTCMAQNSVMITLMEDGKWLRNSKLVILASQSEPEEE